MPLLEDAFNSDQWFDKLIGRLDTVISETDDDELREGGKQALSFIKSNKSRFINLGQKSFTLFIAYVAAGNKVEATKEYLRGQASAEEIINSILDDAIDLEIIRQKNEELKAEALELVKLLIKGARYLLPFIVTLL